MYQYAGRADEEGVVAGHGERVDRGVPSGQWCLLSRCGTLSPEDRRAEG